MAMLPVDDPQEEGEETVPNVRTGEAALVNITGPSITFPHVSVIAVPLIEMSKYSPGSRPVMAISPLALEVGVVVATATPSSL